jgi:deferrochelatase/peroxidase EfeB
LVGNRVGEARVAISRRALGRLLGAAGAGALAGSVAATPADPDGAQPPDRDSAQRADRDSGGAAIVPWRGEHQAGILTPAPSTVLLTSYDIVAPGFADLLREWTREIAALTTGRSAAPEVAGLGAARLTLTTGIGPGIAAMPGLVPLPAFAGDRLDPARSGGDVCVQACADDPLLVVQATNTLSRIAAGVLEPRWQQYGTRPTSGAGTPRNLFGFKDGTANAPDPAQLWTTDPPGGTFLVVRRIAMDVPAFARLPVAAQEAAVGRHRGSGAPLGGHGETDEVVLFNKTDTGRYVVPADAHVRRVHPLANGGARILRRGYSYVNSPGDQGLLFLSFQRSPEQFIRIQRRIAARDAMSRFTEVRGSAVFFILPGVPSTSAHLHLP